MPTYVYTCIQCGDFEYWRSIHADPLDACPTCGDVIAKNVTIPMLAGIGARSAEVAKIDATEARWSKDMPAYKRLRHAGYQPQSVDGADRLEATAQSGLEINSGGIVKGDERRIKDAIELSRDIMSGRA
jgi:putative FmdB family regulatory protein